MASAFQRLYYHAWQDLLMGDRLALYRALLRRLKELGYCFQTMSEFAEARRNGETLRPPVCLLRNDIDSDPRGAARMFACDREEGVRASYFFRLSTLDRALAQRIVAHGGEVGYHFEEIASTAARMGLTTQAEVDVHIDAIRDEFRHNFARFAERLDVVPRSVAAHGDFINRQIGIANGYLLTQPLRTELGIVADAYDYPLHTALAARYSDRPPPKWWHPADPMRDLEARPATVSILVHPRQWTCNSALNARLSASRLIQEAVWRWRAATAISTGRPIQRK